MSMINKVRLEEFANGLWAKIKMQIGDNVVNLTYDETTNILTATKKDGTTVDVDLTTLATTWTNLEHTEGKPTFINLCDNTAFINGSMYDINNGNVVNNPDWQRILIDVKPNNRYIMTKRTHDSSSVVFFEADGTTFVSRGTPRRTSENGWEVYHIEVPNNTRIAKIGINIHTPSNPNLEIMFYEGTELPPSDYIPYNGKQEFSIDGEKVRTTFNPRNSNLNSKFIDDAIRELALRAGAGTVKSVNSINPDAQGNVALNADNFNDIYSKTEVNTELAKYVPLTEVDNAANKIPRVNAQGKLELSILPAMTINETFIVDATDQSDGEQKAMALNTTNGDLVIMNIGTAPNIVTKKYLCGDSTKTTFNEKFIELSFPTDGVTQGELQAELAKYVPQSETGTGANQVLRLDTNAKIDDTNLKIATSQEVNDIINNLN